MGRPRFLQGPFASGGGAGARWAGRSIVLTAPALVTLEGLGGHRGPATFRAGALVPRGLPCIGPAVPGHTQPGPRPLGLKPREKLIP